VQVNYSSYAERHYPETAGLPGPELDQHLQEAAQLANQQITWYIFTCHLICSTWKQFCFNATQVNCATVQPLCVSTLYLSLDLEDT